jgi:phage gp36-like protein
MAAYATRAELYALALPQAALLTVATDAQDSALEAASRKADSYLGVRFELPLTAWGVDLKEAVAKMAAWQLLSVRGFSPEAGDAEVFRRNHEDAVRWLEQVAKGAVTPVDIDDSDAEVPGGTTVSTDAPFVVQPQSDSASAGGLWEKEGLVVAAGTVGASRKRGW